ncbi:hypothetical protein [Kitasatospora sp. NPDC093558]|uniref:hypothetical protein n=1 Tax=Kitasatospora sp. NPDC093558 TaxID=3155201 RepID=UPI00342E0590
MGDGDRRRVPERVVAAERLAAACGFSKSRPPEVGRLPAAALRGAVDGLRLFYLTHPGLLAAEVPTTLTSSAILATRKDRKERTSW